jgi:Protein of unknown function (DUF1116)
MTVLSPDQAAFAKIDAVRPEWVAIVKMRDLLGLGGRVLLHAGPAFLHVEDIPQPVLNSLCIGCIREGWAADPATALQLIQRGAVAISLAQDHGILVPLAGIVGPSSALLVVADAANPTRRFYSPLNEGMQLCTRLGTAHADLPAHLAWLDSSVADWIASRLAQPIGLFDLVKSALAAGDDCHSRTMAGSAALVALLAARTGLPDEDGRIRSFLDASPAFALNVWMAMCGLLAGAAEGTKDSQLVTRAGGNGVTFGFQIAGRPGEWMTMPAPQINGRIEPAHDGRVATRALGDSALVDFMGFGGQALDMAPVVRVAMESVLPADLAARPLAVLEGVLTGLDRHGASNLRRCISTGLGPVVLLGMIDAGGVAGRIGGGCVAISGAAMAKALL